MTEQEEKLMQERVLAHHEREQDAETRYRKLKEFLSINGYNVGHLLRLDEGKLLTEHAEACRDSFKICMENRDKEITDLRSRLAAAQARAERAEGEIKLLRVAFAEASHNDCQAGIEIDALKKQLSPTSPQGRTDGEPWQISRAVDALEWAFSAVLLAEPGYANTESYQIHEATLNGLRSMIGKPVTAPEVKGGAA